LRRRQSSADSSQIGWPVRTAIAFGTVASIGTVRKLSTADRS
jgi:hypothetical protein